MTYSFNGPSSSHTLIKKADSPYSPQEVIQWLESIGYKHELTESDIASGSFKTTLENLHVLVRMHLVAFPFVNCDMHHTSDHSMDVTPQGMFRHTILRRRGSYCFGLNTLFLGMLRGLGYRAYAGSARVSDGSNPLKLGPLSHMFLLVQPDSETHFQPGFGGTCLTKPIYLRDGAVVETSSEKHRLIRAPHPSSSLDSLDSALLWHLQISRSGKTESSWKTLCLSESIFWKNLMCVKYFVVDGEEQRRLGLEASTKDVHLGKYILFGSEIRRSHHPTIRDQWQYLKSSGVYTSLSDLHNNSLVEIDDHVNQESLRGYSLMDADDSPTSD
ncbi:arylamine N-acetyltransferase 1 [Armillaria borealis]|uniref:Arylamine N-acetyltransferase 1 n=1 Tax=Armillaria borealis TaxID=47425 RepID=A0AA39K1N9_9AGAR|nr:arylamine N-acetyltransferase 1 [Armillaria borealis]